MQLDPVTKGFHRQRLLDSANALASTDRREKAVDFVRLMIAKCSDRFDGALPPVELAAKRWGHDSAPARILKAGVSATSASDALVPGHGARDAFFSLVFEASVAGRLSQVRRVPFNARLLTPNTGSTGYWVGEKQAVPVSKVVLAGHALESRKVAGLVVLAAESLQDPRSEQRVTDDLVRACAGVLDEAFLGDQAGTKTTPAGLLAGITPGTSTGSPADDLAALVDGFAGDLATSAVITDSQTALELAMTGGPAFQNIGVQGGTALGLPWLCSQQSPRDSNGGQILLIDQAGLALGLESFSLARSTAASIEMDDDPAGDGSGPTGSTRHTVHLFTAELVAFLVSVQANWRLARAGAVSAISGASYSTVT